MSTFAKPAYGIRPFPPAALLVTAFHFTSDANFSELLNDFGLAPALPAIP
jgi:hypothetical protein